MCNWTEDAERFLILSIYYAVTQTVFFVSHLRREYYRNAVNLVSWSIGLLILVFGAAASYTEGSAAGTASVVLLLVLAAVPVLLGCILAEMDENGKLLGGIVGALCIIIFSGLFLNRFTGAALLLLVFGIAVLALLEFRRPGDLSAGTVLLEVAVLRRCSLRELPRRISGSIYRRDFWRRRAFCTVSCAKEKHTGRRHSAMASCCC